MTQSQVPSAWRRATPDRGPGQALGGDGAIGTARRGEGQVAADHGPRVEPEDALLADGEFPARRHRAGKVRPDGVLAAQHRSVAAVDDGVGLIKGHHALDVSRPLADDQQPLQILRIMRGFGAGSSGNGGTPVTGLAGSEEPLQNSDDIRTHEFALPQNYNPPSLFPEQLIVAPIARCVSFELLLPKPSICLRQLRFSAMQMLVPKAPVDEHYGAPLRQGHIWTTWQITSEQAEPQTEVMSRPAHHKLGPRASAAHCSHVA